jgi:hypothetical protein
MPRAGQVREQVGLDGRLTDRIAIGVLAGLVPRDLVDEVLAECGRKEQRVRLLPARVVVYYTMALTLFFADGYEEVMRRLVGSLRLMGSWRDSWVIPSTAAISKARARLGAEPLRVLFRRVAVPLAVPGTPGAWCGGRRLMAVDGTNLDIQDTPGNLAEFGLPSGGGAFPQARVVALGECGTHAVVDLAFGGARASERDLFRQLLRSVGSGMLVITDRGFIGHDMWGEAAATGADLLWRVRKVTNLVVIEELPDGSYLSVLVDPRLAAKRRDQVAKNVRNPVEVTGHAVRVIEYEVRGRGSEEPEIYRLITTILDSDEASAVELAEAYHHRWELESSFDEVKTHQRGGGVVLRSKSPEMVRQEIYSLFLTHYAIRELMARAAEGGEETDLERLSFTRSLRVVRRQVTDQAAFSP